MNLSFRNYKSEGFRNSKQVMPLRILVALLILVTGTACVRHRLYDFFNSKANLILLAKRLETEAAKSVFTPNRWRKGDYRYEFPYLTPPEYALHPDSTELNLWVQENNAFNVESFKSPIKISFADGDSLLIVAGSTCGKNTLEYILSKDGNGNYVYLKTRASRSFKLEYDTTQLTKNNFFSISGNIENWRTVELSSSSFARSFYLTLTPILKYTLMAWDQKQLCSEF